MTPRPDANARPLAFWLAGLIFVYGTTLFFSRFLPCIDLPQHIALAASLRRVWNHDSLATSIFMLNGATHNGGMHVLTAGLARWMSPERAAHVFVALYPAVLFSGVFLLLRNLALPTWRTLLVAPLLLGFSFGWGFLNFCMGTALSFLLLGLWVPQLQGFRVSRALVLVLVSLLTAFTHVLAMLFFCFTAAALGLEWLWRERPTAKNLRLLVASAVPLLPGPLYDLWVYQHHLHQNSASYTTPPEAAIHASIVDKFLLFGNFCSGLYGSYLDTLLAWLTIGLLVGLGALSYQQRRAPAFVLPASALLVAYVLIPGVFCNTHLVYPRLAVWIVLAALLAIPRLSPPTEQRAARWGCGLAVAGAVLAPVHFALYNYELRGLDDVLNAFPAGARGVGVLESAHTRSIRRETLTHVAALQVARRGLDDGFNFARWMGFPLTYVPGKAPPYPEPSWEHNGKNYAPLSPHARAYPWVLFRSAVAGETSTAAAHRIFGAHASQVQTVMQRGSWIVFDTTALASQSPHSL